MSTSKLLAVLALLFAVVSFFLPSYPLLAVAVVLLAVIHLL